MFEINYSIKKKDLTVPNDDATIRYQFFMGDIELIHNESIILIDWGWVPILDFAICLVDIYEKLKQAVIGDEKFEFTESDENIVFRKSGSSIVISTSFKKGFLEMKFEEFEKGIKIFYRRIIENIFHLYPESRKNSAFLKYVTKFGTL